MRRRNIHSGLFKFSGGKLLVASSSFLALSLIFSFIVVHQIRARSLAQSLSQRVGIATASAETPVIKDDTLVVLPDQSSLLNSELSNELTNQLTTWGNQQPAGQRWAVGVRSLDDATLRATANSDQSFGSASIFKLYLVYGLGKKVPFDQWSKIKVDGDRTYADCVEAMMARSDNPCAIAIGNRLGWSKLDALLTPAGYYHTSLKIDPTPTTVTDTVQIVSDLYTKRTFSKEAADFVLNAMSHSSYRKGIVAGCPDCQVANKTGDANGSVHDAGVVTINGKHYAIAIMSERGSQAQIAEVTGMIRDFLVKN